MSSHDDRSRRTRETLADDAVWAATPDVLDDVLAAIEPPRRDMPRRRWIAAAAAIVAVLGVGSVLVDRTEPPDFTLAGTELAPAAAADVRVVETPAGVVLRLEIAGLEPAASGSYYQGWVVSDDAAVSVGTFHMRGGDGSVAFWSGVDTSDYPELIITRQAETAGPARSDQVVMTGRA
ncbi:MAG: anti-sigma factor [Acidimicrobiia bacterium]